MKKIGLLSDTHGFVHERIKVFFKDCREIWHAGDVGSQSVLDELAQIAPLRVVYGNIDNHVLRAQWPEDAVFVVEGVKVYMTHIGSYPGRYDRRAFKLIDVHLPDIFICGHSHILKVMPDKKRKILHINPGAAGNYGFHLSMTAIRFELDRGRIDNLEVFDLPRPGREVYTTMSQ